VTEQKHPHLSRRGAFRFRCSKELVAYKTAYEEGEGVLTNISTDGCAVERSTNPPELHERILLTIEAEGDAPAIEAQAQVVRVEERDFAVRFTLVEQATKTMIRNYFAGKLRGR